MPMYPVELLHGSEKTLQSLQPNNQKYENLLVMSEDEQQVYIAPSQTSRQSESESIPKVNN